MAGISPVRRAQGRSQKGNAGPAKAKVNKAPPPAINGRYAVISADLLQQLQKEVGKQPSPRDLPQHELLQSDPPQAVNTSSPAAASPTPARQKSGMRAARATGYRPAAISVKHAAVSTDEEGLEDGLPAPPGARHASVGTVNAVEEGTQTAYEQEQPIVQVFAAPTSPSSPKAANAASSLLLIPPHQQVVPSVQIPDVTQGVPSHQAVAMPSGWNSPHTHGFSDLFYLDRSAAEREKERKRLQAQILADQIQEQRERKEEEQRKRQEEDFREEQRLERERREIEERHQREQAELAAKNRVMEEGAKEPSKSRRKVSKDDGDAAHHRGAGGTYTTTAAADSTGAGPWVEGEERRRRRRRRRSTDTQGGGNEGTWRTTEQEQKRTWQDPHANSLSLRLADGRDTASPVPWLSSPQGDEGLSTVQEASSRETKRTEARRRRRRRERDGRDVRERQETERGEWAPQRNQREALPEERRGAAEERRSEEDEDEPRLRRRGGRTRRSPGPRREEQATSGEEASHPNDRDRNVYSKHLLSPKLSETELREQIGSLVRVCEQLLRERSTRESDLPRRGHSPRDASPRNAKTSASLGTSPPPPELSVMGWRQQAPSQRGPAGPEVPVDGPARPAHGAAGNDGLVSPRSHASHAASKNTYSRHDGHHGAMHGNYGMNKASYGGGAAGGGGGKVSDMNSWGADDPRSGRGSPEPWPSDALVEFLQAPLLAAGAQDIPGLGEGQSLRGVAPQASQATAAAESSAKRDRSRHLQAPINNVASPFSPPMVRGMAVRRSSGSQAQGPGLQTPSGVFGSGMAGPGWGGRMIASPPPMSRGGLNVQANWVPLGLGSPQGNVRNQEGLEGIYPSLLQEQKAGEKQGPGQVPIGINPSIQAQSAILREMYPNAAAGPGLPGPLSLP